MVQWLRSVVSRGPRVRQHWLIDVTHEIQTSLTDSTFCYKTRMILILDVSIPGWKSYITINTEVNPDTICKTRSLCYIFKSFANFVRNDFYCLQRSNRSAFEIRGCNDYDISEKIRTTETPFAPFGSVTIGLGHSENGTRISLTVSEIFDRKHIALNAIFLYSYYSYYYSY